MRYIILLKLTIARAGSRSSYRTELSRPPTSIVVSSDYGSVLRGRMLASWTCQPVILGVGRPAMAWWTLA